jgi:hypothetical protein
MNGLIARTGFAHIQKRNENMARFAELADTLWDQIAGLDPLIDLVDDKPP